MDAAPIERVVAEHAVGTRPEEGDEPEPQWRRQLTRLATAAHDPVWTADDQIIFTTFENYRFTVRALMEADSLVQTPRRWEPAKLSAVGSLIFFSVPTK